ncbi:PREDICTED: zinc finger BED domain-containing protein DAYSLEEPER-like isoform X2 [Camelina sativa]|uniref:Zinc finger BED domain-containing protein DAYSLEEPER-like isoform X1 n=1 Tax=Camelina sativa TaxID=90675 RepID=A0ABM0SY00_CAMSA|nr:PREDICTED: zinc finger BED domain-containing protein DAYSLEEPER-like isoform X1 [Camelina sativa]XP_019083577.1 PREDICTED: zinc finger BED domain-containing protein DAYSLEEPER-like isoform X2 [Camelina sativa]
MDNNSLMLIDNNGSFEIDDQSHMDVDTSHNNPSMALFTPTRTNDDAPTADTDDGLLPEPGTLPAKRRRKKSMVWEHFTIETSSPGSTKACCKHCRKSFAYITGQKLAGTSHLKRHIQLGICPMSRDNTQLAQVVDSKDPATGPPKKRQRSSATHMNFPLDQDRCYNEMAKMIIMHEYPLHMVEHSGFTGFVQALRPQFSMASFNTIHGDCVNMYLSEKQKLSNFISEIPGRVNLTVDLWTSNQSVGYAFVTGHFIDRDWKLTHRLLNVAVVPSPDSDFALNQPIAACLSDWNLERRLSSLTVGQSVVNKASIENLRCCLSARNQHVLNGQLLLGSCYARLLSSMAQDLLGAADYETPIKKVRESVKYVKTKDSCGERFDELKRQLQTPSTKDLLIDNQTKWDTSYNMLLAACEHKEVFSCLGNCDLDYKLSTSPEEWRKIEILCSCLKILYDAANVLTGSTRLTANDLYHEMTKLQLELSHTAMSEDADVRNLAHPMKEKFDEYWRECFLLLAVAVVMDPRFKMKLIEFSFSKAYGEDADKWIRSVDDAVHELYLDYTEQSHSLLDAYVGHGNDGFSETDISQVHFHHDMPHEYHHSNGLSHDQVYEQPEDGNQLDEKPRDHVLDGHDSQEVAQTQVNQLTAESSPHAQEEKVAEPLLQEDQSGGVGQQENQPMEGLSGEGQQTGTVSVGGNTTQGEEEGHLGDAGSQNNHIMEGLSEESTPIEGLTQGSLTENLQSNGEPTPAQESQLTDETSHGSQAMEETHYATQSAEEMAHETQLIEEFPCESQPSADIPLKSQPVEDTDITQDSQLGEGNVPETQSVEEIVEDTQPVEEVLQEETSEVSRTVEDIPPESHHTEEMLLENQQVDDNDITHDMQPMEEMLEDTQPVEDVAQEVQEMEKHDEIQSVEEEGHEIQPVEELLEDTQPVDEMAQEEQLVEEKHNDVQPVEGAGHETQAVEGILEDTQPVEEVAQEVQPMEQIPEPSQNPQNADGILCQGYSREGEEAPQKEQQSDEGIASDQHPQSHAMPQEEEAQHDSQSHAVPQEEATFTISQEGHHVDVLLQEGHHLEASSQEFPLITIGDGFSDFELYISEVGSHQQMKSELDQYLEESLMPRSQDFEVLRWWSLNRTKYPTLSKMAADVLSLPFCTVSPDSVFDTEVKKMDNYRSSLRHVTLEALFCAKDWFKHSSSSSTSENNLKRES